MLKHLNFLTFKKPLAKLARGLIYCLLIYCFSIILPGSLKGMDINEIIIAPLQVSLKLESNSQKSFIVNQPR